MLRKHFLIIEIAVIVVLVFLLGLKFHRRSEKNAALLEGEHQTVEVREDGSIVTADGRVFFPDGYQGLITDPGTSPGARPQTPTPTPEEEGRLAMLSESEKERYYAAVTMNIPEGIAFANVQESLSVREKANGDSKQIGYLYPGNYCIVVSEDGEWAKITSGTLSGYCRKSYLIRGTEAIKYAKETVVCKATLTANANIRSSATTKENNVIKVGEKGKSYVVEEAAIISDDPDARLFVKVKYDNGTAYIAMGMVKITYEWTPGKKK